MPIGGDLTRNFSRSEFACKHCGAISYDRRLVDALQELRDLAKSPITIISAYRCPVHNLEIGGANNSRHLFGDAADIVVHNMEPLAVFLLAEQVAAFRNGGIGLYDGISVHVDTRPGRARWSRIKGVYRPIGDILEAA
jgi:uncharacterized protein YcbK (DUF882 family)